MPQIKIRETEKQKIYSISIELVNELKNNVNKIYILYFDSSTILSSGVIL